MAHSFQNEIPKARVNITLDVDTNGAKSKKELPMKLLAMGDYSHGQARDPISDRTRISINKINFNEVMATLAPHVQLQVKNKIQPDDETLNCDLTFRSLKDFSPEHIVASVPMLNKLLAMRHLLKDLKANVLDNQAFRKHLEAILKNDEQSKSLSQELQKFVKAEQPKEA